MHDAIVVGARCAGASLAMLLARKGYRVLLVDRATFPSDQTMSTHLVWQNGTNRLRKWGLLDKVAATNCPPMSSFIIDFGSFTLAGEPPAADGQKYAFAPRRFLLDKILVDAAAEAGAEVRDGFFVRELDGDGDRVTGIAGTDKTGATVRESARIVIGADGMNSFVARAVQAPQYNARPRLQGTYFTYWSDVPVDGVEFYVGDWRGAYAMPTNDGLTVVGANWTARDVGDVKADIETNYLETLESWAAPLAERVRDGRREERWRGAPIPNFFRKPYGPGWALVGDAGVTMDPCTAEGISNALRDADLIADALDDRIIRAATDGGRARPLRAATQRDDHAHLRADLRAGPLRAAAARQATAPGSRGRQSGGDRSLPGPDRPDRRHPRILRRRERQQDPLRRSERPLNEAVASMADREAAGAG